MSDAATRAKQREGVFDWRRLDTQPMIDRLKLRHKKIVNVLDYGIGIFRGYYYWRGLREWQLHLGLDLQANGDVRYTGSESIISQDLYYSRLTRLFEGDQ